MEASAAGNEVPTIVVASTRQTLQSPASSPSLAESIERYRSIPPTSGMLRLAAGDDERSSSLGSGGGGARFTARKARTRGKDALVAL
ncbi:hypothetical protein GUJ93_ZPchr0014g46890 [Zizania palustris]|uniref:Uncharacterized protein n=1 Tax=Zizania palustris TaxID=103762 RepID=A0A8J5SWB6_ZIZPA|nr:hypothetical protein GUJ93_ZPchr0014g46890 [Zizania palustris]